jgi:hypothetical protein
LNSYVEKNTFFFQVFRQSATTANPGSILIEDNGIVLVNIVSTHDDLFVILTEKLPHPSLSPTILPSMIPPLKITYISDQLQSVAWAVQGMLPPSLAVPPTNSAPLATSVPSNVISLPKLLSTMSCDEVIQHIHHDGVALPSGCPCDIANTSESKTHWSAKELYWAIGCRNFWNLRHLFQVSCDGEWVDGSEFSPSLGSFTTIPKGHRSKCRGW